MSDKVGYSYKLTAERQLDAEDMVAAMIFDSPQVEISEEDTETLAREIVYRLLREFRHDLFDDYPKRGNSKSEAEE